MKDEVVIEGPAEIEVPGRDTTQWRWFLNGHEVVVEISETARLAVEYGEEGRLADAVRTKGQSEVLRMLDWDVPNDHVVLTTDNRYDP